MPLPPRLDSHPIVQTYKWVRHPIALLEACRARFGEMFCLEIIGFGKFVIIANPEAIKEIFAGDPDKLPAGLSNSVVKPFLGANSMLVLDGSEHARQRKLIMPSLHGERMEAYGQTMLALTDDAIDSWPLHTRFAMHEMLQGVTLQVIIRTIFGIAEGERFQQVTEIVRRGIEVAMKPFLLFPPMQRDLGAWSPWGKVLRFMAQLDALLLQEVKDRQEVQKEGPPKRNDILSMLVAARDEQGQAMTFQELRDELMTMLVAGHETTATGLGWTLCGLLRDAELLRRLRAEIDGASEGGRLIPERVAKLQLLDATVREGLRRLPVVPLVARQLQEPARLGGFDIPAGWMIAPSIYLAHHRASVFPDPDRFDPDRFLRYRPSPAEYFPFGGGHRRCIGAAFAMYEMKMILGQILFRTELQLEPNYTPRIIRRSVTLAPSDGVPTRLFVRRPRAPALPI